VSSASSVCAEKTITDYHPARTSMSVPLIFVVPAFLRLPHLSPPSTELYAVLGRSATQPFILPTTYPESHLTLLSPDATAKHPHDYLKPPKVRSVHAPSLS